MRKDDDSNNTERLFLQLAADDPRVSVIIEEENEAVYAYLLREAEILADVWLYNTGSPPESPPWRADSGQNAPYKNAVIYMYENQLLPENAPEQLGARFSQAPAGLIQAEIGVENVAEDGSMRITLLAVLREDERPGWCRNACFDGPAAKCLSEAITDGLFISDFWQEEM